MNYEIKYYNSFDLKKKHKVKKMKIKNTDNKIEHNKDVNKLKKYVDNFKAKKIDNKITKNYPKYPKNINTFKSKKEILNPLIYPKFQSE